MLQSTPRICLISWSFSISTRTNIHRTKMKDLYLIARNLYPINKINIQKKIYYGKRNMCVCVCVRERERERYQHHISPKIYHIVHPKYKK